MSMTWWDFFLPMKADAVLRIEGDIPSKKNKNRFAGGRMYRNDDVEDRISNIGWDLKAQWLGAGHIAPCSRRFIVFKFSVAADQQDMDNMATTLLDCMQAGQVLVNDNTKHSRQTLSLAETAAGKLSRDRTQVVEIFIYPEVPFA